MKYLLVLNDSKQIEETNKKQRHSAHDDKDKRKTVQPHAGSAETSFLGSHFIAHHCDDLYIRTINGLVQFIGFAISKDCVNQLIIFKAI